MTSVELRFAELARQPLPRPAGGATLQRWRRLAEVAAEDLALVKLYESHADAVAILAELGADRLAEPPVARWAVWAAEPPDARLDLVPDGDRLRLHGRKAWCSGAGLVSHALVTGWDPAGNQQLAAVELAQAGITAEAGVWQAPGMSGAGTVDLCFENVPAVPVGGPGQYTGRPGFWHGGCGIAACWYGGTLPLARAVLARRSDPYGRAHLGAIDLAMRSLRALLIETAGWLDTHPAAPAAEPALRLRGAADATARLVLDHAGRALGAGPLCRDPSVARHFADLPVFLRQTHGERDLAELGGLIAAGTESGEAWRL
jgi:hypothetical protein